MKRLPNRFIVQPYVRDFFILRVFTKSQECKGVHIDEGYHRD